MKIKVVCRTDKVNKNGEAPLFIRFTDQRSSKFVSLGLSVEPCYWDFEGQMLTADCQDRRTLQSQIDNALEAYHKKIRLLEALDVEVNFDTLLETNGRKTLITVEDGFKAEIERLEALGKFSSAGKHKSALLALQTYHPVKIALEMVDLDYLKGFEMYLRGRGNGNNSIATRFAIFKAIYNKAVKEGRFEPKKNPFTTYKVGSLWTATRKRAITKDEIQKIAELQFPSDRRSYYLQFARDMFLFSYFTAGINFCDIARLRHRDIGGGRVSYSRHKTQKMLSCRLSEQAKAIVDRYCSPFGDDDDYLFPVINKEVHITERQKFHRIVKVLRKVNLSLKSVGERVGLSFPLTTYVARHSYATVLKRSGVNVALISESLGHSDLATTQIYLDSFENSQIDEAMKNLL